jgi:Xaa-Pro aminopeptidase
MSKQDRIARLEALRQSLDLDTILLSTPANLYYFSGFRTTIHTRFNGLLIGRDGGQALVTSYVDEQIAKLQVGGPVWVRDIRIHGPIARPDVFQNHLDTMRSELAVARTIGVDGISFVLYNELNAAYPHLDVRDVSGSLNGMRGIKDAGEIADIKRACDIALAGLAHAQTVLAQPGISEVELSAELEFHARRAGADGLGYPILISAGDERIAAPHAAPSPEKIAADTPFVRIAFAPTFNSYATSLIRTFCPGKPPAAMQRLADAFFVALSAIESMLRPGATVQDILNTVGDSYTNSGVRDLWGGDIGYSLGVTVHEPPRIGGTDTTRIAAGMVLAIMPGIRKAGEAMFHHADVYLITESGCECLSKGLRQIITYEPTRS